MTDATLPSAAESPGSPVADGKPAGKVLNPLSKGYRRYALWMLLIIYTLNFLDRTVLNILIEDIKRDLSLEDWQLGALSGLAFAIFYTVLGVPIARYAERANRPHIIGVSVAVWSAFTMVGGAAQNFWQMAAARIGVGVGEAGCSPPAHSLISDYVPKEKRASAIAFYSVGTPLGSLIGLALGGLVADAYGWRVAFLVAGAPGVIVALLAAFTLPEPRRMLAADMKARAAEQPTFRVAMKILRSKRTFWLLAFAASIKALIGYGHAPFTASFFFRVHTAEITQLAAQISEVLGVNLGVRGFLGLALGLVAGTAGVIGAWIGGPLADRFGKGDARSYALVPAISSLLVMPVYIAAVTVPSAVTAIALLAVVGVLGSLWYGPVYGTAQGLVPPYMRATTAAVLLFIINLVGLGIGPLLVGVLSTSFDKSLGLGEAEGVRWALILSELLGFIAFVLFWMARKTIREETVS